MAAKHLTDAMIRGLPAPVKGNAITYDDTVTGLGIRVTAAGHKAFVLGYTVRGSGKQRRYTIGDFGDWSTKAARNRARELKAAIDQGGDPLADIEAEREAPTVSTFVMMMPAKKLPEPVSPGYVKVTVEASADHAIEVRRGIAARIGHDTIPRC